MFERWKIAPFAKLEFLLEIAGEIVVPRKLNRRTKGRVGLYENFTQRFAAAGTSGHLCEKLKSAFARSKIWQMQREVSINNSDERHVREMQAFRNHLGADQNVDLASTKIS